jgi:hypothetical protein
MAKVENEKELTAKSLKGLVGKSGDLQLKDGTPIKSVLIKEAKKALIIRGTTKDGKEFLFEVSDISGFVEYGTRYVAESSTNENQEEKT